VQAEDQFKTWCAL